MKKTVLITGASRGIGKAAAILFANEGYNVIINYFNSELKAKLLASELIANGFSAVAIRADVSNKSQVYDMFSTVDKLFGSVDVLINNAGISQQKLFTDVTEQEWEKIFAVNVKGMYNCINAALPAMIRNHTGKIINVSSIWGITGASCEVAYSATKAAVIGLTKALAKEVGPSGITVNCVAPGVIETDMNSSLDDETISSLKEETPLGVIGTPHDIAQSLLFLASNKANFITGQVISPNGGIVV